MLSILGISNGIARLKKNEIRAEAIFFRAWAHRCLAGMYGDTPIILEPARSAKVDYERSPRMDVWKQCAADLNGQLRICR